MQKLIKLNDQHYIIVNDSEIKEGDYKYHHVKGIVKAICDGAYTNEFKITHSTQPLEGVKHIPLSEVEEAINGYSVEKMAKNAYLKHSAKDDRLSLDEQIQRSGGFNVGYSEGFKAHQELVKDKLTIDIDVFKPIAYAFFSLYRTNEFDDEELELEFQRILNNNIQSLLPKTEWDIEFDEQGKIKLI